MELKPVRGGLEAYHFSTFNRTSMELKQTEQRRARLQELFF